MLKLTTNSEFCKTYSENKILGFTISRNRKFKKLIRKGIFNPLLSQNPTVQSANFSVVTHHYRVGIYQSKRQKKKRKKKLMHSHM